MQLLESIVKGNLAFTTKEKDGARALSPLPRTIALSTVYVYRRHRRFRSPRISVCELGSTHILNFRSLQFLCFPGNKGV